MDIKDIIQEVKSQLRAEDVKNKIALDLNLKLDKSNKCLCFNHNEKVPSMSFDMKAKKFRCFSCSFTYDIFNHYQEYYNKSFIEALNSIISDFNLSIDKINTETNRKAIKPPTVHEGDISNVIKYMNKRKISESTIKYANVKADKKGNIVFEYKNELGEHITNKYRPARKIDKDKKELKMWFEKETNINTLYLMDKASFEETLVITEGECMSGETEVLTKSGWVRLDRYEKQEVMVVDENMNGKFEKPLAYINKEYEGYIYEYRNRNYSFAGTPNHNMVYIYKGEVIKRKLCDMTNTVRGVVPTAINVHGTGIKLTNNQIALYLAISADASIDYRKNGNMYVKFGFKKKRKICRLLNILKKENIVFKHKEMDDGRFYIYFTAPKWFKSKKIPMEWIEEATMEQRHFIIDEMVYWDGNMVNNRNQLEYSSKEIENAEFMQILSHTCGYNSSIIKRNNSFGEWYKVSILLGKKSVSWQNMKKNETTRKVDRVYCVTVSTGMILIRNNGKVSVTGNCDALSLIESGYKNAVSVPTGCKSTEWININWDFLEKFEEVILWFDNDDPGKEGVKEVFNRLPNNTVKVVYSTLANDINELLYKYGKDTVLKELQKASIPLVEGVKSTKQISTFNIYEAETIQLGIDKIDDRIIGMPLGSLNVITGRTGEGKSTILNQFFIGESIRQGYKVFLFSGELTESNAKGWLLDTLANENDLLEFTNKKGIKYKKLSSNAINRMDDFLEDKFFLYTDEDYTIKSIIKKMEIMAKRYGVKVFCIDNLMVTENDEKEELRNQTEIVKMLKSFAKKYNAIVHLVAHPRKAQNGQRDLDKSDISGSANITNLADYVVLVQRMYEEDGTDKHTEFAINKDRYMGNNCKIALLFNKDRRRFYCKNGNGEELEVNYLVNNVKVEEYSFEELVGGWE